MHKPDIRDLPELFGDIDIYLFDQLQKGRFTPGMRILDAGCGEGRNLVYLLRCGFDCHGIDSSPLAIEVMREVAARIDRGIPSNHFRVEPIEKMEFVDETFDAVICNAVLHFARDEDHWRAMIDEMARVLRPGGLFFARLMSTNGIEQLVRPLGGRHFELPDGNTAFLVDEEMILRATIAIDGELLEPIKTVNVQNRRCMTTWVVRKRGADSIQ
ncbi:methyltransferase domain-containing protein [bacterium]|nr:methyltransferase domain-containing protein [bacterium]